MENINAKQIIENNFWEKCVENNCDKNRGFDYLNFFTNDCERKIFIENILPQLIDNNYIEKRKSATVSGRSFLPNGLPITRVGGTPTSVYFFTEEGLNKLGSKYEEVLIKNYQSNNSTTTRATTYNIDAPSSNINIGVSNSTITNTIHNANNIFSKIRHEIESNVDNINQQTQILKKLDDLEKSQGTNKYKIAYSEFIALTANYVTIVTPFLPALEALIL